MASEAQRLACKRYYERTKATTRAIMFRFSRETDADVLDKLDSVPSKIDYIRKLVREDVQG